MNHPLKAIMSIKIGTYFLKTALWVRSSFFILLLAFGAAQAQSDFTELSFAEEQAPFHSHNINSLEDEHVITSTCGGGLTTRECRVVQLVNNERQKRNLVLLKISTKCQNMARSHSSDMVRNRFFSHTSPSQGTFSQRVQRFGLTGSSGENIGMGSTGVTPAAIMNMWMNSPAHRNNILKPSFRSIGVGIASGGGLTYFTQCFNSRAN